MSATRFVAIGASGSDGLSDVIALLHALGQSPDAVVMLVLHRSFDHPSTLREVLSRPAGVPVMIATDNEKLEPGRCYIGEPAIHLTLLANTLSGLVGDPARAHRNRTIDLLFKSVAKHAGCHGTGVVLSGALDDGSRGLEAIHQAGGLTMALLRSPRRTPGMPENAINYESPVDCIGSVEWIAREIRRAVPSPRFLQRIEPKFWRTDRSSSRSSVQGLEAGGWSMDDPDGLGAAKAAQAGSVELSQRYEELAAALDASRNRVARSERLIERSNALLAVRRAATR